MQLPTSKTTHKLSPLDLNMLIYGLPKIGKSTFCSKADGALFLATEPGLNHLDVYQIPITSWDEMLEALGLIAKGNHQFRTVVVDTVDNAYRYCQDYVCKREGIAHPSDLEYGKGTALVNDEFRRVITKLGALPYGLIMTSHAQEREVTSRGSKFVKSFPTLPESARKILLGFVDLILFADVDTETNPDGTVSQIRVLRTKPDRQYEAGDRTGRLPASMAMYDRDNRTDFDAFMKVLTAGEGAPVAPPVVPSAAPMERKTLTAEQAAVIRELLPQITKSEADLLKKAKVVRIEDIAEEVYGTVIEWMSKNRKGA